MIGDGFYKLSFVIIFSYPQTKIILKSIYYCQLLLHWWSSIMKIIVPKVRKIIDSVMYIGDVGICSSIAYE